jgi:hypothetical protein
MSRKRSPFFRISDNDQYSWVQVPVRTRA